MTEVHIQIWKVVDGSGTIENTTNTLYDMIMETIKSDKTEELEKLWIN